MVLLCLTWQWLGLAVVKPVEDWMQDVHDRKSSKLKPSGGISRMTGREGITSLPWGLVVVEGVAVFIARCFFLGRASLDKESLAIGSMV